MKNYILVVDDDQLIRYALAKGFKDSGHEVATAATALEALEKFTYCPHQLCLIDIHLADMNGLELMEIIREMCPKTKFIIMTASYHNPSVQNENYSPAIDDGSVSFFPKPFDLSDLRDMVRKMLRSDSPPAENFFVTIDGFVKSSRKCLRKPCTEDICFQMSVIDGGRVRRRSLEAQAVDISATGIGLLTGYPLRESQVIGFDEKMDNKSGVVVWSEMIDAVMCRSGVKFA